MKLKILFCDRGYSESRRQLAPLLPGCELAVCGPSEVRSHVGGADVVVPYGASIDAPVIRAGSFGLVQQFGVGLETVDVDGASAAGVWVARVPSAQTGNAESVAEHAIFLMLALARSATRIPDAQKRGLLGEPSGMTLAGKSACIIGLGGVGAALGLRLQAMGMRLVGVRVRMILGNPRGVAMRVFPAERLHEAVAQADFVIVCATLDDHNYHLIDRGALQAMKAGAIVINVARGGLVETSALAEALASGHIAGAGLDVVEDEPIDHGHELMRHNVIVTPHIAGVTDSSYAGIAAVVADNVLRFVRGEAPQFAVNDPPSPRWRPKVAAH
jgi:phosphoglycerate dehydrogenase-like enzyme